jgi:hypothetical protein
MFGHRFFGARYFGPRYWGPGVTVPPVGGGAHSGVYRRVLIELYEQEWAAAQAKKTKERMEELGLRQEARVHRVKRVRIEPTIVGERLERPSGSQGLEVPSKKPSPTPVKDLLAAVMDNLAEPVPLVNYYKELSDGRKKKTRRKEEEIIAMFLITQLEEEEA